RAVHGDVTMALKTLRLAGALAALALGGCASVSEFEAAADSRFRIAVPLNVALELDLPSGEIEVVGVDGDELSARIAIECPAGKSSCVKRAQAVEFVAESTTDLLRLALNRDGMTSYRGQRVKLEVSVPASRRLHAKIGSGSLLVTGVRGCVSVDMLAGEAVVYVPAVRTGSVALDAGVGDASLRFADGRDLEGRRALLIGAEVEWTGGPGQCDVEVDLQFGEISVVMQ
ncbi:MAG: hypothetical protein AAGD86_08945, partial [Pseudomonadota bacterium]